MLLHIYINVLYLFNGTTADNNNNNNGVNEIMKTNTDNNPRIYCGTYAKYNSGSIHGKWFDLTEYNNIKELYKAFKELHKDDHDPEFMFQDWENIPSGLISESWLNDEIFLYVDLINNNNDINHIVFMEYWETIDSQAEFKQVLEWFNDSFIACVDKFQDFADEMADEQINCYKNSQWITNYFDYEKYADHLKWDFEVINCKYDNLTYIFNKV